MYQVAIFIYLNSFKKNKNYNKIINSIQGVRGKNNINWMKIVKIAFKYSPIEAEKAVSQIYSNDQKISKLVKKLTR